MNKLFLAVYLLFAVNFSDHASCSKKDDSSSGSGSSSEITEIGAQQFDRYLPLLKNKKVGLIVNHTSTIGSTHLVDTLLSLNIQVKKIFAPEHGFRGKVEAGEIVSNETDAKTGLPILSLYGSNKKPTRQQLSGLDILVFDIQDVGVRFYTYISTMHYAMEACAENNLELVILDRPNPNGYYIDGPVLEPGQRSFVGMHPIPVVHGLTIAELAQMINGEKWLDSGKVCKLHLIPNKNYTHNDRYSLPVNPSPNLPNDVAIQLYPSLGLFEGTSMSMGRGTEFPFQVVGAPDKVYGSFTFTPRTIPGVAKNPPHENKLCYGVDLRKTGKDQKFTIQHVIDFYKKSPDKTKYFNSFFSKLAGNTLLRQQIEKGMTETEIKATWVKGLDDYKAKRKKYLLYPDFK